MLKKFNYLVMALAIGMLFIGKGWCAEGLKTLEMGKVLGEFREAACVEPIKAFEKYGYGSGVGQLKSLGKVLCPEWNIKDGWKYFFGTSVGAITSLNEETVLVLFYSPWGDVGLLTEWQNRGGNAKITDAELVAGDLLRGKEKILEPWWRRSDKLPPPLEVVFEANRTLDAFSRMYVDAHTTKNSGEWREKLNFYETENDREANQMAVGVLFAQSLSWMYSFFHEKEFESVKNEMGKVRNMLVEGNIEEVLKMADKTSSDNKKILRKVPLRWEEATMVSAVKDKKNTFVFLSAFSNPEYFACFWFKNADKQGWFAKGSGSKLERIYCMGHTLTTEELNKLAKKAGIERR